MKYRLVSLAVITVAVAALGSLVFMRAAQNTNSGKNWCIGCSVDGKTTPRTADGHPDLSGIWDNQAFSDEGSEAGHVSTRLEDGTTLFDFGGPNSQGNRPRPQQVSPDQPTYKPEYWAKVKEIGDNMYGGSTPQDPQYDCLPLGVPRSISGAPSGGVFHVVQTPQLIAILHESSPGPIYRVIYMDGRPHLADADTSFMGDSIGHWEGNTLVVDTVALNDETWLDDPRGGHHYSSIHSDKLHVVERFTRNGDELTYEATVEDPIMFTKPWVLPPTKVRHGGPDNRLVEGVCSGRDKAHIIKPTAEDQFRCNYCPEATRTPGTGVWTKDQ